MGVTTFLFITLCRLLVKHKHYQEKTLHAQQFKSFNSMLEMLQKCRWFTQFQNSAEQNSTVFTTCWNHVDLTDTINNEIQPQAMKRGEFQTQITSVKAHKPMLSFNQDCFQAKKHQWVLFSRNCTFLERNNNNLKGIKQARTVSECLLLVVSC